MMMIHQKASSGAIVSANMGEENQNDDDPELGFENRQDDLIDDGANSDGEGKDDLIEDPWNYDAEYEEGILAIDNMYGPVYN